MRKKQVLMAFNKSRQQEIEVINTFLSQIYSALDSIKLDSASGQVASQIKLNQLQSLLTNVLVNVLNIEFLPLESFARKVQLRPDTVRRKLNNGEILGIKLRNKWYVRRSELWHFQEAEQDS